MNSSIGVLSLRCSLRRRRTQPAGLRATERTLFLKGFPDHTVSAITGHPYSIVEWVNFAEKYLKEIKQGHAEFCPDERALRIRLIKAASCLITALQVHGEGNDTEIAGTSSSKWPLNGGGLSEYKDTLVEADEQIIDLFLEGIKRNHLSDEFIGQVIGDPSFHWVGWLLRRGQPMKMSEDGYKRILELTEMFQSLLSIPIPQNLNDWIKNGVIPPKTTHPHSLLIKR